MPVWKNLPPSFCRLDMTQIRNCKHLAESRASAFSGMVTWYMESYIMLSMGTALSPIIMDLSIITEGSWKGLYNKFVFIQFSVTSALTWITMLLFDQCE